jgi:hypothetical protein
MWTSPVLTPALTFVLIFMVGFPFLEKLMLVARPRLKLTLTAAADADISGGGASLDVRFDFHSCSSFP